MFLCTEDLNYFNAITYEFGDKIIYMKNNYRSFIDNAFKNYPRKLHRFKLGEEILLEALIMSKCNSFLYTNSNVSEFVKFLDNKKKINYFLIDNGFNSSNEYLARWLWYCKNILPKFLGGFDKVTNVKNINIFLQIQVLKLCSIHFLILKILPQAFWNIKVLENLIKIKSFI